MCKNGLIGGASEWIKNIDTLLDYRIAQKSFIESAQLTIEAIGSHFKNESTDWKSILKPLQWVHQCHSGVKSGSLDTSVMHYLDSSKEIRFSTIDLEQVNELAVKRSDVITELASLLQLDLATFTKRCVMLFHAMMLIFLMPILRNFIL